MRNVTIRLLPDGSGRVRIHWFRRMAELTAPITTSAGEMVKKLPPEQQEKVRAVGVFALQGMIACQPARNTLNPNLVNGRIEPCCHTDYPPGVTCPECMATPEFKEALKEQEETVNTAQPVAVSG